MPALLWAAAIYVASSIPSGRIRLFLRYDKILHLIVFSIFGLLVYRALHPWKGLSEFSQKRIVLMIIIVLGYGLFDEIHQGNTPGRTVDVQDFLADVAGGVLAGSAVIVLNYLRGRGSNPG